MSDKVRFYHNPLGSSTRGVTDGFLLLLHGPLLHTLSVLLVSHWVRLLPWEPWIEILTVALPLVFHMTLGAGILPLTLAILFASCCLVLMVLRSTRRGLINDDISKAGEESDGGLVISLFRGYNVLLVILAILAVDFDIFPRSFCKTELHGFGLMDIGTGTTIVASALSSHLSRCEPTHSPGPLPLARSFRGLQILWLGVMRLLALKLTGYHEHPSEHGTHWNFFFTLFAVWQLAAASERLVRCIGWNIFLLAAAVLAAIYERLLLNGLGSQVLHHSRPNFPNVKEHYSLSVFVDWFVWHNREGLAAVWSHSLMFVLGAATSRICCLCPLQRDVGNSAAQTRLICGKLSRLKRLTSVACASMLLFAYCQSLGLTPSRRSGNIAFVLLVIGMSVSVLAALQLSLIVCQSVSRQNVIAHRKSFLLEHLSNRALPAFILGNIITGAVNLSFRAAGHDTRLCNQRGAMIILASYCGLICVTSVCIGL